MDCLCTYDLSGLDPKTIDPRSTGWPQALINFSAFLYHKSVAAGDLSRADAARGFDDLCLELDAIEQRKAEG